MNEWASLKLSDLTLVVTKGTTPSTIGSRFVDNGINFVKSEAISYDGRIDKSTFGFIDEKTHNKLKRSQLKKEDILFSMAGIFLGKNAIVKEDLLPANTNQALAIIRLNLYKTLPIFIHYYLRQKSIIELINNMSGQSAQPNINFEEIKSIPVLLPPLPEQKAIAEVLSSLDDKIDLLHRQNKTLEQMAETLFRQWFIEEADESWEKGKLGDVSIISAGGDKPKLFSLCQTKECPIPIFSNGIDKDGLYGFTNTSKVSEESVTVSARGTIGFVVLRHKPYFPIVRLVSLIPKKYKMTAKYLYLWLKLQKISGTGTTQQQLTVPDFSLLPISIPPCDLIFKFTEMINPLFKNKLSNIDQIRTLTQLRDTLLPKLMSGEIRVSAL